MRLIDLDDLLKFPIRTDNYDKENGNEHFVLGIESVLEYAKHLSSVDVVHFVLCKDCINCTPVEGGLPFCTRYNTAVFYGDFCSCGERRGSDV